MSGSKSVNLTFRNGVVTASGVIAQLVTLRHVESDVGFGLFRRDLVQDRCGEVDGLYKRDDPVGDTVYFLKTDRGLGGGMDRGGRENIGRRPSPKIQAEVDSIRAKTKEKHGYVPKTLPRKNSTPTRIVGTGKLVTPDMLNQACALVLLFFTSLFMYVQFYCSW